MSGSILDRELEPLSVAFTFDVSSIVRPMPRRFASLLLFTITLLALLALFRSRSPSMMQIANPASEYCVQQGGKLEIVKDQDGNEIGMCRLLDGTVVEEWELFRSQQDEAAAAQQDGQGATAGETEAPTQD